jgi:hypothetical protein
MVTRICTHDPESGAVSTTATLMASVSQINMSRCMSSHGRLEAMRQIRTGNVLSSPLNIPFLEGK